MHSAAAVSGALIGSLHTWDLLMFNNLPVKWRMTALVAAALTSLVAIAFIAFKGIDRLGVAVNEIGTVRLPSVEGLLVMSEGQTAVKAATLWAALYENDYSAQQQFA